MIKFDDFSIESAEIGYSSCFGGVCPMIKTASDNLLAGITQKKNHAYLHVIAMGAGDYYGENRNGDFFYEKDLITYYKTFETAGVFVQHDNKNPEKSLGDVALAHYNHDMHRVELVIEVSKQKAPEYYNRIERGERLKVSMGVKVPSEHCSYCGAVTKGSLANRCSHLTYEMHQQKENGQVVYAINVPPMNFFDISFVSKPADDQGHALYQKVASEHKENSNLLQDKIATLIKHMPVLNTIPNAVTDEELNDFKQLVPSGLRGRLISSKRIILKPSEIMFLGTDMPAHDLDHCREHCDNEDFIHTLMEKLISNGKRKCFADMLKTAEEDDYDNPILKKLVTRTYLVKQAAKEDFYGNKQILRAPNRNKENRHLRYAQFQVNMFDGKRVTVPSSPTRLADSIFPVGHKQIPAYYTDLVDDGYASNIVGILPDGAEQLVYAKER